MPCSLEKFWNSLGLKVLEELILTNLQWGLFIKFFEFDSLQGIRIHQVYIRLLCDPEVMKGCHVILKETNGAKSIEIVTKTNFNDHARDMDLNRNNAQKRRKLE